jgi:hypothetical protein
MPLLYCSPSRSCGAIVHQAGYWCWEKEVGVTWELVGLAMGQVAVKWNTTGD